MIRSLARWFAYAVGVLSALLLAVMLSATDLRSLVEIVSPTSFEAAAWRVGDLRTRGAMVDDLIGSDLLAGKLREEVVALLGPPDHERSERLFYVVDIGQRWGSTPWTYQLQIYFDATTHRVSNVFYAD